MKSLQTKSDKFTLRPTREGLSRPEKKDKRKAGKIGVIIISGSFWKMLTYPLLFLKLMLTSIFHFIRADWLSKEYLVP